MKPDPLKDKIDALALEILDNVNVKEPVSPAVVKAMSVVKVLGQWFAIKNKIPTDDDEEGSGIDEYQKRLGDQTGAGGGGPGTDPAEDAGVAAAGDTTEPESDSGDSGGRRPPRQARKSNGDFASGRGDRDNGGPELARYMASIPVNAGCDAGHQHDPGRKGGAVRGGGDSGPVGVEDAGESDLDHLVD